MGRRKMARKAVTGIGYGTSGRRLAALLCAVGLTGCLGGGGGSSGSSGGGSGSSPPPQSQNHAPTISGAPSTSLVAGTVYDFRPTAADADGDALSFSARNQPAWASFDPATGRLTGTPTAADVGQFSNVVIEVSDGRASAALGAFTITVNQVAFGSVTLSWTPPTTNADGSVMTDLAGYRIYYGMSAGNLNQVVALDNAGLTRWVVENLSPATWYFAMTSINTARVESARTGVVSRVI